MPQMNRRNFIAALGAGALGLLLPKTRTASNGVLNTSGVITKRYGAKEPNISNLPKEDGLFGIHPEPPPWTLEVTHVDRVNKVVSFKTVHSEYS